MTYLKNFAEYKYSRSEIYKSHPAIVLELNHIKFELVPAIIGDVSDFKIPNKQNSYLDWMSTNPTDLDGALANNQTLRRLVRIAKIWNAKQGYIYDSYELEKWIVGQCFCGNLADHFYGFCKLLPINYNLPQYKKIKINTLKNNARQAECFVDSSYIKSLFE